MNPETCFPSKPRGARRTPKPQKTFQRKRQHQRAAAKGDFEARSEPQATPLKGTCTCQESRAAEKKRNLAAPLSSTALAPANDPFRNPSGLVFGPPCVRRRGTPPAPKVMGKSGYCPLAKERKHPWETMPFDIFRGIIIPGSLDGT